jgi:hypothetical protein
METGGRSHGLDHYLVVHGTAWITEGGASDLLQRLAHTHLGPGELPAHGGPASGLRHLDHR